MLVHGNPSNGPGRARRRLALRGLAWLALCGVCFLAGAWAHREGLIAKWVASIRNIRQAGAAEFTASDVPLVCIDIKAKNFRQLEEKREQALKAGLLYTEDGDFVPAWLRVGDSAIKVEMRLKGDGTDHLNGRKWSFRIKVAGGAAFMGMRVFSLQHPRTKGWDAEWLYHQHLRSEGVLGLRYAFVRVKLNGEDMGIYAMEEHFSKELLESQRRRESVIVKLDETDFWRRKGLILDETTWRFLGRDEPRAADGDVFQTAKVDGSPSLSADRDAAVQLLRAFQDGKLAASRAFKVDELAKFLAVSELWSSWHALRWHNLRFYYDPVEGRLEPIGFDANNLEDRRAVQDLVAPNGEWSAMVLADPAVARAYCRELLRLSREDYMPQLKAALRSQWQQQMGTLHVEWPQCSSSVWEDLARKQSFIRRILARERIARGYAVPEEEVAAPSGRAADGAAPRPAAREMTVRLANITALPVEVIGLQVGSAPPVPPDAAEGGPLVLPPAMMNTPPGYATVHLSVPAGRPPVTALCRIAGTQELRRVPVQMFAFAMPPEGPRPMGPPVADVLAAHSQYLAATDEPAVLQIRPGDWRIDSDLILPEGFGLRIRGGTTLRFAPGVILLATGPLDFKGKPDAPIRLLPQADAWAGLVVIGAPPSRWENVQVERATCIDRNGWRTTGGVCFCDCDVTIARCRFLDAGGEDTVNVVRGTIHCSETEFAGSASDAFDGDFMAGVFTDCQFHDIAGDALDVSGSELRVDRCTVRRVADKGISGGEQSVVVATGFDVDGAGIGLASKDCSQVLVTSAVIRNARYAVAAYEKKAEYGPATIEAEDVAIENCGTEALVQTGSRVTLNGRRRPGTDVDVEALYGKAAEGK